MVLSICLNLVQYKILLPYWLRIEQVIQKSLDKEFKHLLHLANFMTGNKYREAPFSSAKDLKSWLKKLKIIHT